MARESLDFVYESWGNYIQLSNRASQNRIIWYGRKAMRGTSISAAKFGWSTLPRIATSDRTLAAQEHVFFDHLRLQPPFDAETSLFCKDGEPHKSCAVNHLIYGSSAQVLCKNRWVRGNQINVFNAKFSPDLFAHANTQQIQIVQLPPCSLFGVW